MSTPTARRIAELLARIESNARELYRARAQQPTQVGEDEYVRRAISGPYGVSPEARRWIG